MKRSALFAVVGAAFLLTANCSQEGPSVNQGTAGSGGAKTGAGGTSESGGAGGVSESGGAGGARSSGESGGAGGKDEGGAGGSSARGGSGGAIVSMTKRDAAPAGGESGSGGSTPKGGSGGTPTTTQPGTGGVTDKGGSTGGEGAGTGGASSGTGGATSSGGVVGTGGSTVTPADIVPDLDGFYWEGTCSGNVSVSGKNCPLYDNGATSCPSGSNFDSKGTIRDKVLSVKGTKGTIYSINFEVRGVVGTRCYTGGKAASTATPTATGQNNTWYEGGRQANDSIWNTYELHVDPPVSGAANVYFLNAFPSNPDWCQKEATYEVKYSASFKVTGGGTMKLTVHDANCQGQQNCGSNESSTNCDSPRSNIDLTGMSPAATFKQPPTNTVGTKTYYPQWLYFDVKSVSVN